MSRLETYRSFRTIYSTEDVDKPHLLQQQRFLSSYVLENYSSIDKMLLFHGIGTGKTCTSITIAETIMERYPEMKTLVILPARLITNFKDELISTTCGLRNKYLSPEDYTKLFNPLTSNKIRKTLDKKINEKYDIRSFEKLAGSLKTSTEIIKSINAITKNKIVIIDEIHNYITSKIKPETLNQVIEANRILKITPSLNGVIMRLLTKFAHPTCKMFLLTATPIYDNFGQFIELILNLCPTIDDKAIKRDMDSINKLAPNLRGKISFYKLDDKSFFPEVETEKILIPLTTEQENEIKKIIPSSIKTDVDEYADNDPNDDEIKDSFCLKERQLCISTLNKTEITTSTIPLHEYAPKIFKLLELLQLKGKHLIYCNFIDYGLEIIAKILEMNGWSNYLKDGSKENYNSFVIWDSNMKDKNKSMIKEILNNPNNLDGKFIRVILGSPSIKEGISFKHIQYLHQIDPVWNSSGKEQIEGRCIRYKSHEDIPLDDKELKRKVIIYNYISVNKDETKDTCDEKLYKLILNKYEIVKSLEEILHKFSIDYYLSRESAPTKSSSVELSPIITHLKTIDGKKITAKPDKKLDKNTCPENRRPNEEGKCLLKDYTIIRKNHQGFDCCYKKEASTKPAKTIDVSTRVTRSSARKEKQLTGGTIIKRQLKKY